MPTPSSTTPVSAGIHTTSQNSNLELTLEAFLRALAGKNRSAATIAAYRADVAQFIAWLPENNLIATTQDKVGRADITEYLAALAARPVSGVSRARKLAALREYFRFLVDHELIAKSPADGIETPRKERNKRTWLLPDEYRAMLASAGSNSRDFAILQVFLQTGVRVSELCDLRLTEVDMVGRTLTVRSGKGMAARIIELEKKATAAIKNWLAVRPPVLDDHLFLSRAGQPISQRGVRKLVTKHRQLAGITKKASCHSFRHTFGTLKAQQGISPFRLKDWLGHANLNTTQIYVHMGRQNAAKEMEATSL